MGTRALTHVKEGRKTILTIYRQFDGYPTGHGQELVEAFKGTKLCNGFGSEQRDGKWSNGLGCFAASLVTELKGDKLGGIYIYPPGSKNCGQDYTYTFYTDAKRGSAEYGTLRLKVVDYQKRVIFDGPFDDFDPAAVEEAQS